MYPFSQRVLCYSSSFSDSVSWGEKKPHILTIQSHALMCKAHEKILAWPVSNWFPMRLNIMKGMFIHQASWSRLIATNLFGKNAKTESFWNPNILNFRHRKTVLVFKHLNWGILLYKVAMTGFLTPLYVSEIQTNFCSDFRFLWMLDTHLWLITCVWWKGQIFFNFLMVIH